MYRLHFTAEDLARTRITAGAGPFAETVMAAERLRQRLPTSEFRAWRAHVNGHLGQRTRVLANVFPRDANGIDFGALVGPLTSFEEGLDRLLGVPPASFRAELSWHNRRHRLTTWSKSLADADPRPRRELVEALASLHDAAVRPYWAHIDARIRADRAARALEIVEAGLEHLFATLCPAHIRWRHPILEVDTPLGCDADVHLGGRGLVLTPSVFTGSLPFLSFDLANADAPANLAYPVLTDLVTARRLWTVDRPADPLAALLGRTRSVILDRIADGCGTVELARRVGISSASVSHHTAVLRNNGLISTRRDGASVIHTVTSLGAALLDSDQAR
ncbi:winged helix-turn-helix domain-containing protein [Actinoplanes sp. NPDC051470]|uniref:ArsR/SmtB family transcription factor n=1 Tax=unclassified Actinoplanes TaxID=2626549 RepID=UPI0034492DC9